MLFTLEEIAQLFQVHVSTVRTWIIRQKLVQARLVRRGYGGKRLNIVLTADQLAKLMDIKAPILGGDDPINQRLKQRQANCSRGGLNSARNRLNRQLAIMARTVSPSDPSK